MGLRVSKLWMKQRRARPCAPRWTPRGGVGVDIECRLSRKRKLPRPGSAYGRAAAFRHRAEVAGPLPFGQVRGNGRDSTGSVGIPLVSGDRQEVPEEVKVVLARRPYGQGIHADAVQDGLRRGQAPLPDRLGVSKRSVLPRFALGLSASRRGCLRRPNPTGPSPARRVPIEKAARKSNRSGSVYLLLNSEISEDKIAAYQATHFGVGSAPVAVDL